MTKVDFIILSTIVEKASNEELKQAFKEIEQERKEGVLKKDGIVQKYHQDFENVVGEEQNIRLTQEAILYEMARRFAAEIPSNDGTDVAVLKRILKDQKLSYIVEEAGAFVLTDPENNYLAIDAKTGELLKQSSFHPGGHAVPGLVINNVKYKNKMCDLVGWMHRDDTCDFCKEAKKRM